MIDQQIARKRNHILAVQGDIKVLARRISIADRSGNVTRKKELLELMEKIKADLMVAKAQLTELEAEAAGVAAQRPESEAA